MNSDKTIEITGPYFSEENMSCHLVFRISGLNCKELVFSFNSTYKNFLSPRADSALVALLAAAMEEGKDVHVLGEVSEQLLFNCNKYVIPLLAGAFNNLSPIKVTAKKVSSERSNSTAVVTGLSNGVDSLTVCADHLDMTVPPSLKLTHFLFNDVGSHGAKKNPESKKIHDRRIVRTTAAADFMNLPLIHSSSNLDYFYTTPFAMTHTLRNAAVALCLQNGARKFFYASGFTYEQLCFKDIQSTAYIDPVLLPLLSTESIELSSSGSSYTRAKKTAIIADSKVAWKFLDVCIAEGENCSICWKCARTIMTLQVLAKDQNFMEVFDIAKFNRVRSGYIAHIHAARRDDPYSAEIIGLMKDVKIKLSNRQFFKNMIAGILYLLAKRLPVWRLTLLYKKFTGFMP